MDARRITFALIVALLVSAGATYLLYYRIRSQRAATPSTIMLVAPTQSLSAGTALSRDNIRMIAWPANHPVEGALTKPEQAEGRSLIYPVGADQPLLEASLAQAGSGIGLSVKIPNGMRAVSVRSNDVVGVAGFLYPGSHVDVVLSMRTETSPTPVAQTILQNVPVLTAGQTFEPDPKGKAEQVNVVTLLLTPHDAEKMVLATQQGTIQFILRNGADQTQANTPPVKIAEMLDQKPEPVKKAEFKRTQAVIPVKSQYSVETIAGEKHTTETF
ncbi:MAG: Flp pilus assembly protein CpaB [Acidobacteriaceae bacterium]